MSFRMRVALFLALVVPIAVNAIPQGGKWGTTPTVQPEQIRDDAFVIKIRDAQEAAWKRKYGSIINKVYDALLKGAVSGKALIPVPFEDTDPIEELLIYFRRRNIHIFRGVGDNDMYFGTTLD